MSAAGEETADDEIHSVKKLFELIKPEALTKEKYLKDGDIINTDRLISYLIRKKIEPEGKIDFYEKNRINSRDLAVLLLLDMSGSTNEEHSGRKVVDLEKHAALLLGQGLHSLGDRFSICGFSGNGRENCQYFIYKDFEDSWNRGAMDRLQRGRPSNATRIGPALRHSAFRLSGIEAKKKLIIILTDGKPMDQGYDSADGYAQLDIRRACDENRKAGIETYCISTNENSRTDMEVMFTGKRFIILNSFESLPRILPRLFIKLTS
jgi:nitric oxide reductase activation protein